MKLNNVNTKVSWYLEDIYLDAWDMLPEDTRDWHSKYTADFVYVIYNKFNIGNHTLQHSTNHYVKQWGMRKDKKFGYMYEFK